MEPPTPTPEGVLPTKLQPLYTKGTPHPKGVSPTNLQHSYIKGTLCPLASYPQPTGSTTQQLTTLIH